MEKLLLKIPDSEIDKSDPWGDDKLGRRQCAAKLTKILLTNTTPLTLALNGEWGTGKTYLLKRWQQQLKNEGYAAIYYNSWEDDYLHDPLISLIGQLWSVLGLKEYNSEIDKELPFFKAHWEAAKKIDWKSVLECITKTITQLDANELRNLDRTSGYELMAKYLLHIQTRAELRDALGRYAQKICDASGKPLVFIVDELDRCRPTFAIETLERIKHLFATKNLVFVLGIDRRQLGNSIRSVYGDIDIENYLHRFIDFDFRIPAADPMVFCDWQIDCGIRSFIKEHSADGRGTSPFWDEFFSNLKDLILNHHFSLREIERLFMVWRFVLSTGEYSPGNAILLAALIVLKIGNPDLYSAYISCNKSPKEVIDYLIPMDSPMQDEFAVILAVLLYCTYLPVDERDDSPRQKEIAELLQDMEQHAGITESPICADCLIRAENNGNLNKKLLFLIHDWIPNSGARTINRNTLRSLTQNLELDFLLDKA